MFKRLLRASGWLIVILLIALGITYLYFSQQYPAYEGTESLPGLEEDVRVEHDDYGIPHIHANSTTDAYHALGYLVARERFFQMDLARRMGGGKLSELFGEAALQTDMLMRAMLPEDLIRQQTERGYSRASAEVRSEAEAYIAGVNAYLESGEKPLEYTLLGVEPEPFEPEDMYRIAGYMAYSFCVGGRTEPVITDVLRSMGPDYLVGLGVVHEDVEGYIPSHYPDPESYQPISELSGLIGDALDSAPIPKFEGSNSWVVSGAHTKSGKPILCNDTHIGLGVPQVWYEAHIDCPGFEFFGNFLPGIPYGLVGHNRNVAWGVTMLENDDMDFFLEQEAPEQNGSYVVDSISRPFRVDSMTFAIQDKPDTTIAVRFSYRGPIINDVFPDFNSAGPISCWWDYQRNENNLLEAFRTLNRCSRAEEAASALSNVAAPGLNVTFADQEGNIAWWTVARWQKRPDHVLSKVVQDGSSSTNDALGYFRFSENPQAVNPPWGYVYSANDQPDSVGGKFLEGYYKPAQRADRIRTLIEAGNGWDLEGMKAVITDVTSTTDAQLAKEMAFWLRAEGVEENAALMLLENWDGSHEIDQAAPVLYYSLLYKTLQAAMVDEMGQDWLDRYMTTHWKSRSFSLLMRSAASPWWNNIKTQDVETRGDVLVRSFRASVKELKANLHPDPNAWEWGAVHTLTLDHPFSKASEVLGGFFGIEQAPFRGGHETINAAGFVWNGNNAYHTRVGAQMRIILDLGDLDSSVSIAPAGQSGHVFSPHYSDQAEAYRLGTFRPQAMNCNDLKGPQRILLLSATDHDN